MNDEEIIGLFEKRDENAINETRRQYGTYCRKIAMNILGNAEDSDECINDTMLSVWNSIPPNHPKCFSSFLGRIIRNLSFDRYRAKNSARRGNGNIAVVLDELEECIPSHYTTEDEFDSKMLSDAVNRFVGNLDADMRKIFVLRYWYSESVSEIADKCGLGEGNVRTKLSRTRKKLMLYLEKEDLI